MTFPHKFFPSAMLVFLILSCVPAKKFRDAEAEASSLKTQKEEFANQIKTLRSRNADLSYQNESIAEEYQRYRADCEANIKELAGLRQILKEEEDNLRRVEEKLEVALEDFHAAGVEVYYKDGLLRVQLAEDLLYKTGSSMLGALGRNALGSLAVVLNEYPRLRVIVVGNTDNVKYKKGNDNWTLSTERANGVVRLLNEQYNVDASRLTSAGKAQFNPVAENSTSEGRGQNRRIDIILNPDIERIWNSSGNP